MKIIIIDNYDSFTYNIYNFICIVLKKHKIFRNNVYVIKNNEKRLNEIIEFQPTHIIFGPGKGSIYETKDIGFSREILNEFQEKIPILGICLGHQLIYNFYGGDVIISDQIMHGKEDTCEVDISEKIFLGLSKNIKIMRYHSQIGDINNLPTSLKIIASTGNIIMGIKHKKYTVYGLQFHPESIGTPDGLKIFENYLFTS